MHRFLLFALVLALALPGAAVAQVRPPVAASEHNEGAAIANAFAIESLVLMTGELQAAIEAHDADLANASPYLDLIYLRYRVRGDAVAERLRRASLDAGGPASPDLTASDDEAINRFGRLPEQTLARVASRQFGSESRDSDALLLARQLGWTLHAYTRALISGQNGAAVPPGRVNAETQAFAAELADALETLVVADDPAERASISLVTDAVLMSPNVIRAQVGAPRPDAGLALTVAYTGTLGLLGEDIAEAERQLRLSARESDRALVVSRLQPRLVELSDRAHVIGLALSTVSPTSLPPEALAEQREEIGRLIDLTAMRGRIDQEAP